MQRLIMRFPGGKVKAFTMSYDDGVVQDIRLMEIMNKNGLKGTFNINTGMFLPEKEKDTSTNPYRRLTEKEAVELYTDSGHEVAIHTVNHPYMEQLPKERALYEIMEDKRKLEKLFGYTIRGAAYPYGSTSEDVITCLKNAGVVYARTITTNHSTRIPEDWLRLTSTSRNTDPELMSVAEGFVNNADEFSRPLLFYMWGHSWEFARDNSWDKMEEFASFIGGRDDIWYATNIEIFDYIQAYRALRFGVDMGFVENPTALDVWFKWHGKTFCVKSGESIKLD